MDTIYKNSIDSWHSTIKKASELGISWSDLLDMNIVVFNCYIDGYIKRQETELNNLQMLGHRLAGKISQAVWGSKDYSKPMDIILLHEETLEERSLRLVNQTLRDKGIIK